MVTDNHYRWDFIQLSTDEKPTPATSPKVADGSTLYTSDDSKLYVWYKNQWYEKLALGENGTAGQANSTYGGNDLTNIYTIEELSNKVSLGDFSGLHVGDYITMKVKVGENIERELDFVLADFDYFYGMGDQGSSVYTHHIVMVPDTAFYETTQMNSSNSTSTGYYGSEMHGICTQEYTAGSGGSLSNIGSDYEEFLGTTLGAEDGTYTFTFNDSGKWEYDSTEVGEDLTSYGISYSGTPVEGDTIALTFAKGNLEPYRQAIYTAFGESHIFAHREYMSTSASSATWHTARVELMNENMVYGQIIRASNYFGDMYAKTSLALFRNEPYRAVAKKGKDGSRNNAWLSSISTSSAFCFINSNGIAGAYNASGNYVVRPYFLFV